MTDIYPTPDVIRAINAELADIVRSRLPMRYYGGERWWAMFIAAALVRMADSVDSAMTLMTVGLEADGHTALRTLYEQVVTFAWIAIDSDRRLIRWQRQGLYDQLRLHNDAVTFGMSVLDDAEIVSTKKAIGWAELTADSCHGATRRRKGPDPERILPPVPDRAREADDYWSQRIHGLHPGDHLLGFRGLYISVYRVASRAAHGSMIALDAYVTEESNRRVVHAADPGPRLQWALVAPLFGIALTIAAQQVKWIDEPTVREIVYRATGPDR